MRLATFNVLHGRAPDGGRVDLGRFADAVRTLDADVLALQEVDRAQPRSGTADLTAVAAEAGGYEAARFVPALQGQPGSWRAATDDVEDGSAYGVALLSRRIDRRLGTLASLALLAVPTALLASAPDLASFTALRVAQGVFMAAAFTLTLAHLGERLRAAVHHAQLVVDGRRLRVTVSVGATAALPGDDGASLLRRADRLMLAAKRAGRDRVLVG